MITSLCLFAALGLFLSAAHGQTITNPAQHFASARSLTSGDRIKKIVVDLNGDGLNDMLLACEDPNPDIVERQARRKERGVVRWDAYIKGADGNYTLSIGVERNGVLNPGFAVPFRPDEVYIGQIAEISRYALAAFSLSNIKGQTPTASIIAYTWEADHFKEHQLATYFEVEENAIFDKYLAPNKRTAVIVQEVAP
jgi:hypothetical protein